MDWKVNFYPKFEEEYENLHDEVKVNLFASIALLKKFGPSSRRPHADTLNDSKYANMKELRFPANDGIWRVAFAFDENRKAILLVAGDKSGVSEKSFYKKLIKKADERFDAHLEKEKK